MTSEEKKRGAPRKPPGRLRVQLGTTVDPVTLAWLRSQGGSLGEVVDRLVRIAKGLTNE